MAALRALALDEVWWLVSPQNPLKPEDGMATLAERFDSALAVAKHPRLRVSAIEIHIGTRFTVDTMVELRRRFPRTRFVWLMGADNLAQIHRWRFWHKVFTSVPIAALDRSPYSYSASASPAARRFARARVPNRGAQVLADLQAPAWVFLRQPIHPASATAIRAVSRPERSESGSARSRG
jgi:nicotinate-nucleotide adenylyltransferase